LETGRRDKPGYDLPRKLWRLTAEPEAGASGQLQLNCAVGRLRGADLRTKQSSWNGALGICTPSLTLRALQVVRRPL
jgi:hypothetical protein